MPVRGWYVSGAWLDVAGTWLSDGGRGSGLNYRQVLTQADGYGRDIKSGFVLPGMN